MSALEQRYYATLFISKIKNGNNPFIKGFNEAVAGGPEKVRDWFATPETQNMY